MLETFKRDEVNVTTPLIPYPNPNMRTKKEFFVLNFSISIYLIVFFVGTDLRKTTGKSSGTYQVIILVITSHPFVGAE